MQVEKMKCPRCGSEMNHHADKLMPSESPEVGCDSAYGTVVIEFHSCSSCGAGATRDAQKEA